MTPPNRLKVELIMIRLVLHLNKENPMEKSILITGCSSGIGQAAAFGLQKKGYRVFATARNLEDVENLKNQGLECIQLDVNHSTSMQHAVETILNKTGGTLYAVFNNSGFAQAGAIEDLTRDMIRQQFETNVFGAMELTNLILPIMRKQKYGRIIQNTSILGLVAMPYRGAYVASKFALEGFSNTLRQELRGSNIFVSTLVPGPIQTSLRENAHVMYQKFLRDKNSLHKNVYAQMEENFFVPKEKDRKFTLRADAVVPYLVDALENKKPSAHYYVGQPAHWFAWARRLLPDEILDWVMCRVVEGEMK